MGQIRVVLVDDHRVVSRGVRSYLESFHDITIVGIAVTSSVNFTSRIAHSS